MNLRESLNQRHHRELSLLKAFWLGGDGEPMDRRELTRRLEQVMLSEEALAERIHQLSPEEKGLLRTLLHSDQFSFRSARRPRGDWPEHRTMDLLLSLERKGLVAMAKEADWWQKKWYTARVPLELAQLLGGMWGIDNRRRGQVLSLRRFLACLPMGRLTTAARSVGVTAGGREEMVEETAAALSHAARVEARLAALPDDALRKAARNVLCSHGGLLLLSRLDRETRRRLEQPAQRWEWRRQLEEALLGTIGPVSLIDAGIAAEGEHFVIFMENVDGYYATSPIPDHVVTPPASEAVDFLIDLGALVCFARSRGARVTREGTVYKSTSAKMIAQCLVKNLPGVDAETLLKFKIDLALSLGLLRLDAGRRLAPGPHASSWETLSLEEKISAAYRRVTHAARRRRSDRWMETVERGLLALLPSLDPSSWRPRRALAMRAVARYILDSLNEERSYRRDEHGASIRQVNYRTPDQLRRLLQTRLVDPLCWARILEYGSKDGQPHAIRLSAMGALLMGRPCRPGADSDWRGDAAPRLITTPDFEVLLFPEGDYFELKQKLAAFCRPTKTEQVFHFKITRARVEHAVASGLTADDILHTLEAYSENPLPQNVAYSIKDWARANSRASRNAVP